MVRLMISRITVKLFKYTDFLKAFDKVNHNLLIHKLDNFGIRQSPKTHWKFGSYIRERILRIGVNSVFSEQVHAISGLPQCLYFLSTM